MKRKNPDSGQKGPTKKVKLDKEDDPDVDLSDHDEESEEIEDDGTS